MTFERLQAEVYSILRRLRLLENRGNSVETVDSDITISSDSSANIFFVDTTSGDVLIVLPNATTVEGKQWTFKKLVAANNVHLQPVESQLVDGQLTYTFSNQYESYTIISDGSVYYITAQVT